MRFVVHRLILGWLLVAVAPGSKKCSGRQEALALARPPGRYVGLLVKIPKRTAALCALTIALGATHPAFAQDGNQGGDGASKDATAPPDTGDVSVPKGGASAVIKPARDTEPAQTGKPTPPRLKTYVPPDYPPDAKAQGVEGKVVLELDIDAAGRVKTANVVDPGGHGFDEAAVAAAKKLAFEPARRANGQPAPSRIFYRYTFTLATTPSDGSATPGAPAAEAPQEQSLRGTVLAGGGDVPLAAAQVTLTRTDGTGSPVTLTTNAEGGFAFRSIDAGAYTVTIDAPGFDPLRVTEDLSGGEAREVKYRLDIQGNGLEVTVRGERPPREVVKRTLQRREIDRIPGTNGDAIRSILNLPGVARPPAIAGLLLVRGSGPQDTQTFIDGTNVPLIYHFGGLSSVVPTEVLEKIDFYPGNFSTQYGRVQGGIVDVGLRTPKQDGYHGLLQLDLVDVRGLFEGPIPGTKGWSFLVAARRSYIDAWLGPTLKAAGAGVTQAPVYYDYQALVEHNSSKLGRFRMGFFGSDDRLKLLIDQAPGDPGLSGNIGLVTAFQRLQLLYENEIGSTGKFRGVAALGQDDIQFGLGPFFFLLNVRTITGRLEFSDRLAKGVTLNFGTDIQGGIGEVNLRLPAPNRPGEPANQPFSTRKYLNLQQASSFLFPALYVEAELTPTERLRIVPGVRLDYSSFNQRFDVSPRVNGRYDLIHGFPRSTVKAGIGMFQQPPQFQEVVPPLGTKTLTSNRAIHYAVGYEQDFTRNLEASAEGFVKQLDNLVVGKADPSGLGTLYGNGGRGYVVGGEFLLKYKPDDRFFGWVAYTLSRSVRQDAAGEDDHLVSFDQTHIFTILGSYRLGHGWEVGARFRLVSGNLITPNVCSASSAGCDVNRTNGLFFAPSGTYTPVPLTTQNTERLPLFHQLDLRVDKRWTFKAWQLSSYLDVQNIYNNQNAEAVGYNFNYTARQYVNGLPILPSIGIRADF